MHDRLFAAIQNETGVLRTMTERSGFVAKLAKGQISHEDYVRYMANVYRIHEALETAMEANSSLKAVKAMRFPELDRSAALASDLQALSGNAWRDIAPLAATRVQVARIHELSEHRPVLLGAHALTRRTTDISAAAYLPAVLRERRNFDNKCLSYYAYPGVASMDGLIESMADAIDKASMHDPIRQAFITEALASSLLQMNQSEELAWLITDRAGRPDLTYRSQDAQAVNRNWPG